MEMDLIEWICYKVDRTKFTEYDVCCYMIPCQRQLFFCELSPLMVISYCHLEKFSLLIIYIEFRVLIDNSHLAPCAFSITEVTSPQRITLILMFVFQEIVENVFVLFCFEMNMLRSVFP